MGAALSLGGPVDATSPVGTLAEAGNLSGEMVAIIEIEGLGADLTAMHDPNLPFATSSMGKMCLSK